MIRYTRQPCRTNRKEGQRHFLLAIPCSLTAVACRRTPRSLQEHRRRVPLSTDDKVESATPAPSATADRVAVRASIRCRSRAAPETAGMGIASANQLRSCSGVRALPLVQEMQSRTGKTPCPCGSRHLFSLCPFTAPGRCRRAPAPRPSTAFRRRGRPPAAKRSRGSGRSGPARRWWRRP